MEPDRPGKHGFDTSFDCCNDKVIPFAVYARTQPAPMNQNYGSHALHVASVMISKQTTIGPGAGVYSPDGVAPDASLYSSAFFVDPVTNLHEDAALAAQTLTNSVFATNMSFGIPTAGFDLDGTSTLTSFVDWSSTWQQVLYVVAGNEVGAQGPVPTDNFNGITVAGSAKVGGVYREVASFNVFDENLDAMGERTSTDILAPGLQVDAVGANGVQPSPRDGTSIAAPHVTATAALLLEQSSTPNGRRHEVLKATILNSADKIKDIMGMERTVVKAGGSNWFGTVASSDPNIPLDREMGVGHLNAKRAAEQHAAGRHFPGGVPGIGWDYNVQEEPFIPNRYTLSLDEGDYVSATLVWDRLVVLDSPFTEYERGNEFINFGFPDLNLYLVPAGLGIDEAVASSTSIAWNLEHIFESVQDAGDYELWVTADDSTDYPYALAWWAGSDERPNPGDFNTDGSVNAADYVVWRKDDSSNEGYIDWRANFGNPSGSGSLAAIPEPTAAVLAILWLVLGFNRTRIHLRIELP